MENWIAIVGVAVGTGLVWLLIWIGSVKEHKSTASKALGRIETGINELLRWGPGTVSRAGSPLELTELGKTISADLNAAVWASEAAERLANDYRELADYDIQERCFRYANRRESLTEEMNSTVLNCAYRHGLKRKQVTQVLGIELRDEVLVRLGRTDEHSPETAVG